jgi:oxygen-independent coproporphyrinogen-3 oxidase
VRNIKQYEAFLSQRQVPLEGRDALGLDTLANEYIMLGLRTRDGLDLDHLEQRYGADLLLEKVEELAWLESKGYIEPIRNSLVRLTDPGFCVIDTITSNLLLSPA